MLEETYYSWPLVPMFPKGEVVCLWNPAFDSTGRAVSERRLQHLQLLYHKTSRVPERNALAVLRSMSHNAFAIPFATVVLNFLTVDILGVAGVMGEQSNGFSESVGRVSAN